MEKRDIRSYPFEQLKGEMLLIGEKAFRAKQIYEWIHVKLAGSFEEMTNLSKQLRAKLAQEYEIYPVEMLEQQISQIDGTNKFLFRLRDDNVIESVLMRYQHGNSVCISSQVGCRMGCRFCASTLDGLQRNLTPSEMLGQIYEIQKLTGERVSNVVVMGTGEPLDNYENLLIFIRMLSDEHGLNIGQRNITVSTCGIVPVMEKLAKEKLQITLALSLHGSTQEKRRELMPVANKYELSEVLKAWRNCHVNLIPVNPIKERNFEKPSKKSAFNFKNKLEKSGINVTIRREMGSDIDGACGQLRRRYAQRE